MLLEIIGTYLIFLLISWGTFKYIFKIKNSLKSIYFWLTNLILIIGILAFTSYQIFTEMFVGTPPDEGWNRTYFNNGQIKSEFFINDRRINGNKRTWYENGQFESIANYDKGIKTDTSFYFYADGTINYLTVNKEKKEIYKANYYPNGQLRSEIYNPIQPNSENYRIEFYPNENKKFETRIDNTTFEGKGFYYYNNGSIKYEGSYLNGNINGIWLKKDSLTGNILDKDTFDYKSRSDFKESWDWKW